MIGKLFKSSSTFNLISPQSNLSNRKVLNAWEINVLQVWPTILIFCVEFRKLSHLTRDLSQAEKKITVVIQAEQIHKMTAISLKMVEVVILGENSCHFVSCSACNNIYFLLSLR